MDFEEIKNLIEIDGGKFIIVEEGKPVMVITSFEDYKKKMIEKIINPANPKKEPFAGKRVIPKELESESLKIEDLPL